MMNLLSRHCVRDPSVLVSTASESWENTNSESQNAPLNSLNVQQTSTGRPVMGASSSDCSEWNIDDKWSSQEWKSDDMLEARTGRPVDDKFDIDDDMGSDTVTESNLSPRSRSFLNRVNDRLRKIMNRSPEDAMQDIDKRSIDLVNDNVFDRHWKHLYSWERITQTICIPSKIHGKISL